MIQIHFSCVFIVFISIAVVVAHAGNAAVVVVVVIIIDAAVAKVYIVVADEFYIDVAFVGLGSL